MTTAENHHFVLIYYTVDDLVERRRPFRQDHLQMAQEAQARGELVMAGALGDPPDRALLLFWGPDSSAAETFAQNDPYVTNGLVTRWEVQPWATVIRPA